MIKSLKKQAYCKDGATITNMPCFESLGKSLRNFMHRLAIPFRDLVFVFGRDFRHIVSVDLGGSRSVIVKATICSSIFGTRVWS